MSATRTGLALVCPFLVSLSLAGPSGPVLSQFPSGQPIFPHQLPEAICRGWVEVRTHTSCSVVFWDLLLDVAPHSRLLLGSNEDYIYALTLEGQFDNGHQEVPPGKVSLWSHFGGNGDLPLLYDFSASALLETFATAGQSKDPGLGSLARQQAKAPNGLIPVSGTADLTPPPGSRSFRMFPEIMAIKRASHHQEDYGLRTATQFAQALSQRDTSLIAVLLSPSLFENETSAALLSVKPSPARLAFAERLVSLNDYQPLDPSTGLLPLGNFQYEMRSAKQAYRITLQLTGGSLYVKRLEPAS